VGIGSIKALRGRTDSFPVRRALVLSALAAAMTFAAPATALIEPGNVGALPGNPYPTQPGVTVNGTLFTSQPLGPGGTPQDYLAFTTTTPGETIEFTDRNTTVGSNPSFPNTCDQFCPIYLSLVDSSFTGLGSGSGTIATYADTEVFDWTFPTPGTYYMVMESDGDVNLSYAATYQIASGGTGGGGGGPGPVFTPPLVRKLHVSPRQRGTRVNAVVKPGQPLQSLRISLLDRKHTIAAQSRRSTGTARYLFTLHLTAAYRKKLKARHKLQLLVQITARGKTGAALTYYRPVTLT
jgi:hypothetical protein